MTPTEKAVQLYRYYIDYTHGHYNCKQCCLIAVDEILNYIERMNIEFNLNLSSSDWQKVKQEIEKL